MLAELPSKGRAKGKEVSENQKEVAGAGEPGGEAGGGLSLGGRDKPRGRLKEKYRVKVPKPLISLRADVFRVSCRNRLGERHHKKPAFEDCMRSPHLCARGGS